MKLERWMRQLFASLLEEKRWGSLPASYEESVLEHTVKMAWIIQVMIAIEQSVGNPHNLNFYSLLQCAINHDIGESVVGDIDYTVKNDKDGEREKKAFNRLINSVVPAKLWVFFPPPFDMDEEVHPKYKRFWTAAEHIGYCLFALEENAAFDPVIEKSIPIIYEMREFASVREFYEFIKGEIR